nr:unnamed protein product [Digitaria exilis]
MAAMAVSLIWPCWSSVSPSLVEGGYRLLQVALVADMGGDGELEKLRGSWATGASAGGARSPRHVGP